MTEAYPLQWPPGWKRTPRHMHQESRRRWGKQEKGKAKRPWSFAEARDELFAELDRAGASNVVLSTNFRLTQYGLPSKNLGAPEDQGVAIYFTLKGRQMVMAQDGHTRAEENLRALALVLKYLRGVEDLGGGTMMERAFEGFVAIPAPAAKRAWWDVLGVSQHATPDQINAAWREKARNAHPDNGGSDALMSEINVARDDGLRARYENA